MLITLTTDFGVEDGYVGAMKGVISCIAPGVSLVDITHDLSPQDVRSAAYVLWTTVPYFPKTSVHLVVVDPGVGMARRPIAVQSPWGVLVGPDNGVFSYLWTLSPPSLGVILQNSDFHCEPASLGDMASSTFHGRDIFAPAAAYIARGVPLEALGPRLKNGPLAGAAGSSDLVRLPLPKLTWDDTRLSGEVIYMDHFGNAITSIGRLVWEGAQLHVRAAFRDVPALHFAAERAEVFVKGRAIGPVRHTYGEVAIGSPLALVGSAGMLEIGVNQGHAASRLELQVGNSVEVVLMDTVCTHEKEVFNERVLCY